MIICTIIYLILYIQHIASLVTSVISKKASAKRATPSGSSSPFAGTMSAKEGENNGET